MARVADVGRRAVASTRTHALGAGLEGLGFDVERRHGHVWTLPEHRDLPDLNHLALVVSGLPTDDNPDGRWWPDAGLGEGFRDPVALVTASSTTAASGMSSRARRPTLVVHQRTGRHVHRHRGHHPTGGCSGHRCRAPRAVHAARRSLREDPRRPAPPGLALRLAARLRPGPGRGRPARRAGRHVVDDWRAALVEVLRVPLDDIPDDDLRILWSGVRGAHDAWDAAGRP